jgi:tetratricopeptide (TPR) repeat protein
LKDAYEKMKSSIVTLQQSAKQFSEKGEYDKAIAAWKKILTVREDANMYNTVGDLYIKKGAPDNAVEFFLLAANKFRSDGFYEKAMAIYKKTLNIVPFQYSALMAVAELYAEKGIIGNAVTYYLKAAEKVSRDGKIDKTIDIYSKILSLTPSDINIRTRIADLWLSRGLPEKAANEYAAIASEYMKKDDLEMSIEFFSKAIGSDPQNVPSFIGLSNLAEKQDNLMQALDFAAKALLFSHNDKDILLKFVELAIKTGKTQDAKDTLSKLMTSAPADIFYKKLLGNIYLSEGQSDNAWEELQPSIDKLLQDQNWDDAYKLLEPFKDSVSIPVKQRLANFYRGNNDNELLAEELKYLAKTHEEQGAAQNALGLYRELAELQPGDMPIKNKIEELEILLGLNVPSAAMGPSAEEPEISVQGEGAGDISEDNYQDEQTEAEFYASQGLIDEAISIYEKILAGAPDNVEIKNRIQSLRSVAKTEPAVFADSAIVDKPSYEDGEDEEDYESHYSAGIEYKNKGLLDDAIREFRIVAKDPDRALLSSRMIALCYMEKGVFIHAIAELNTLLESMSRDDERVLDIKYELAEAYMKNNDYEKALEIYSEIHTINPGYKDLSHKIDILKDMNEKSEGKQKSRKNRISYI